MRPLNRFLIALVLLSPGTLASAEVRYVDDSAFGANDGTSWFDAFTTFDEALLAAQPGDEVWVAGGWYPVPSGFGFSVTSGVAYFGGFAGHETSISERNIAANVSEFTGYDPYSQVLLMFDAPVAGTLIDGFKLYYTLSASQSGGGMAIQGGSLTIRNCWFTELIAKDGAGAFIDNAHVTFEDCLFEHNWSQIGDGGGIRAVGTGSLTVRRCRFIDNEARRLYDVPGRGGAIFNDAGSVLRVSECFFDENIVHNIDHPSLHSFAAGGGIANLSPDALIENCIFLRNQSHMGGGVYGSAPTTIVNCLFSGNLANEPLIETPFDTGHGGAIYGEPNVPITVKSCTIAANWSFHDAAGVSMDGTIDNCVLWHNLSLVRPGDDPETVVDQQYKGEVNIRYSNVAGLLGGGGPSSQFPGSIESDPLFVLAPVITNNYPWLPIFEAGNLRLENGSPCLDAGDNASVPAGTTRDLGGLPRFFDDPVAPNVGLGTPPHVDMGVYERGSYLSGPRIHRAR